jgi:hypothetical protein
VAVVEETVVLAELVVADNVAVPAVVQAQAVAEDLVVDGDRKLPDKRTPY